MNQEKLIIAEQAAHVVGLPATEINCLIEYPPNRDMGDLALPCFRFAKTLRKSPQQIAETLRDALDDTGAFDKVETVGGFVNITLNRPQTFSQLLVQSKSGPEPLFSSNKGTGSTVAIDFSSPNIAKPFSVGHLRSTMIGHSLSRILTAAGYQVLGINHLGDWGTQFGKIIAAYRLWGDEHAVRKDPVRNLFELYVRFHAEAEEHPELDDEARMWFKKLEDGDEEASSLWQWFITESLKAFQQTYDRLDVKFTHVLGESFYNDKMDAVVDELRTLHLLSQSDGAEVVDLSQWDMPPCIIRKSDGATIYATRDLASALYRHAALGADKLIYVVGAEQTLHFSQVFKVLELMNKDFAKDCTHVAFGMMKYNGERLSTRRGKIVYLEDVLERAVAEALKIIDEKNPQLENKNEVAEAVGIGAVVFNDLKTYRMHDVDFRYEDVLNFDGETGPYVQYTHARASSVLRKAEQIADDATIGKVEPNVVSDSEWRLAYQLMQTQEAMDRAVDNLDPSILARQILDICHAFNRFYHDEPILSANTSEERRQRLALTKVTQQAIGYGLYLLGLHAPTAM
jgi:arginyl-tRNA synthetase